MTLIVGAAMAIVVLTIGPVLLGLWLMHREAAKTDGIYGARYGGNGSGVDG